MSNVLNMEYVVVNSDTEKCECFTTLVDLAKRFDVKCKVIRTHMKNFPLMPFNGIYSIARRPEEVATRCQTDVEAIAANEVRRVAGVLKRWAPIWEAAGYRNPVYSETTPELAELLTKLPDDTVLIEGFQYHTISKDGTVINQRTKRVTRHMARKRGMLASIAESETRTTMDVRRLIALHFLPNPDSGRYCRYKSDDPYDLTIDNITWV